MAEQSSDASKEPSSEDGEERSAEAGAAAAEDVQAGGSSGEEDGGEVVASAADPVETTAETTAAASVGEGTPAAWFQDPNVPNQQRYWDGSTWTDQTKESESAISTTRRSADERKALLAQQIQGAAARGLRIETQSEFQAVLVEGQPVNHVLHAIITIFSCGLWGIVWIILAVTGGEKREMIVVDEFGNVQLQKLGKA